MTEPRGVVQHRVPHRGDVILGAVVVGLGLVLLLTLPLMAEVEPGSTLPVPAPTHWQWWAAAAAVIAQGALLAWASTSYRRTLITVSSAGFAAAVLPLAGASDIALIAIVPAAYLASRNREPRASWVPWWVAAALVAGAGAVTAWRDDAAGPLLAAGAAAGQALMVVGVPTVVGLVVAARATMRTMREREAIALVNELEARTEASVAAERTAIARELHDIAAHHLSGIALMSSAISQQIDTDPASAKASLAEVRSQSRTLLTELRGLVALLRQEGDAESVVESLAGLETLIDSASSRGLVVRLAIPKGSSIRELSQGIGPLAQFAAYRTVQEAIANATRHAPGARCEVALTDMSDALEIVVTNGPGPGTVPAASTLGAGGFGLRGMEERAALTRSTLSHGATEDGGWRVRLRVPREASSASAPGEQS